MVGIAFNVALLGVDFYRDCGSLLERLRELDLWDTPKRLFGFGDEDAVPP